MININLIINRILIYLKQHTPIYYISTMIVFQNTIKKQKAILKIKKVEQVFTYSTHSMIAIYIEL